MRVLARGAEIMTYPRHLPPAPSRFRIRSREAAGLADDQRQAVGRVQAAT